MTTNTADYRCRACGASIPWQAGTCGDCFPPSGLETRATAFDGVPGGGVCRCLTPDSPVVCEDCPVMVAAASDRQSETCLECGAYMHSLVDRDRGACRACWEDLDDDGGYDDWEDA